LSTVSINTEKRLELVVSAGPDLGARMLVEAARRIIGRSNEADLQLTDLAVSRQHLEVELRDGRAQISVIGSAKPFTIEGKPVQRATLSLGGQFVVGNTAITIVEHRVRDVSTNETCEATAVRSLLGDRAVSARGLSAIFELTEALDSATDEHQLVAVVAAWCKKQFRSESVELFESEAPVSEDLVERGPADSGRITITVPLIGIAGATLEIRLAPGAVRLGDDLRRLLAVAGRVVASSLLRTRSLAQAEARASELRRMAVGSADSFLGSSPGATQVAKLLERLARSDAVALIIGETGVGKSFLARLIHEASPRAQRPFRVINCAAIPENLVEAELFGHERGAFTGAAGAREGALESAADGTLLLDEIGDLPLTSQAKLLRVLEEKQFERLGSNRTIRLRARVLAATNRDLKQMCEEQTFRSDLFFRISVVTVAVPSLRERRADIAMLARRFLEDLAPSAGRRVTGFSPAALAAIEGYPWPGNVRELRNVIEHALVLGDEAVIEPSDLPPEIVTAAQVAAAVTGVPRAPSADGVETIALPADLVTLERRAIDAALRATGGNRTRAAALLGINRVTLYKKLRALEGGEGGEDAPEEGG
jgi:DNA-binding NtrC family response regulator